MNEVVVCFSVRRWVSRQLRCVCSPVLFSVRGIQNPWCGSRPAVNLQNLKWSHAMVWMRSSDSNFSVGIAIISVRWWSGDGGRGCGRDGGRVFPLGSCVFVLVQRQFGRGD